MLDFPQIETANLILGKIQVSDIPRIIEYAGNKKIANNTLNVPHPYEEKDAISWINFANQGFEEKTHFTFSMRLKSTNEFIGGIGLNINKQFNRAELGYWMAEPFWNKGFTTEALAAILDFGFTKLELNKIFATHLIENPASGKVMIKNGMIKEGELVEHFRKEEIFKSVIQYRLTKKEFEEKQKN